MTKTHLPRRQRYGRFPGVYWNIEVADAAADAGRARIRASTERHRQMRRPQRVRLRDVALAKVLVLSVHLSRERECAIRNKDRAYTESQSRILLSTSRFLSLSFPNIIRQKTKRPTERAVHNEVTCLYIYIICVRRKGQQADDHIHELPLLHYC